jgi:hypothetical protein
MMMFFLIAVNVLFMIAAAIIASRKGYNAVLWFFAGSPLGVLILAFQPNTISGPFGLEEELRQRRRANRIAISLIVVGIVIAIFIFIGFAPGTNSSQLRRSEDSATVLQAATEQAAKEQAAKDQAALDAAQSAQAAAEAARRSADEAASQAKLEAEENEVKAAAEISKAFEAQLPLWRQQFCPNCFEVQIQNTCTDESVLVAANFKFGPDTHDWATSGWWTITAKATTKIGVVSANSIIYFYAETPTRHWSGDGQDGSIMKDIVANNFFRKANAPLLGKGKRTVSMFKRQFTASLGTVSLGCG